MMYQNEKKTSATNTLTEQLPKSRRKRKKTSKMSSQKSVIEPKINEDRVVQWYKFIAERHRVWQRWLRRDPYPWTQDQALIQGRFCNVFRYLDRESLYVMNHIILKLSTLDPSGNEKIMCKSTHANEQLQQKKVQRLQQHEQLAEKILFNIIIFRAYVNNGASMDLLGLQDPRQFDAGTFMEKVKYASQQRGGRFSSAAYNVGSFARYAKVASGPGSKVIRAAAMFKSLCIESISKVWKIISVAKDSNVTYETLLAIPGIGPFVAYQIAIDIGYWEPLLYNEAKHSVAGPGAKKDVQLMHFLVKQQTLFWKRINIDPGKLFSHVPNNELNLMAVENCLCEGGKYFRFHTGTGHFKQRYRASSGASDYYLKMLKNARQYSCIFTKYIQSNITCNEENTTPRKKRKPIND